MTQALFLAALVLASPAAPASPVEIERVDLNVHLDPRFQALYATAKLVLRNRGEEPLNILEFAFPGPLGARVTCRGVWDREGELGWRFDPAEEDSSRKLLVALRSPFKPGKKLVLGVSYEASLAGLTAPNAPALVSSQRARLLTTGWYPLLARSHTVVPRALRLVVRLPKECQVRAPVKLKKIANGTTLASYELTLKHIEPETVVFRAEACPSVPP